MHRATCRTVLGIFSVTVAAVFSVAFSPVAVAGDRLLVGTFDSQIEVYDIVSGSGTSRPAVALPGPITAMERSPGGAWLYVVNNNGGLLLVDTRSPTIITAPGPAGGGTSDLAVHPNRSEVYINSGVADVIVQDAAGSGAIRSVPLSSGSTGKIERLAVTHTGDRVYAWDSSNGELREWQPASGRISTVETVRYDIREMDVSADDSFVVLAGTDTWQAQSLGDPADPVHVVIYRVSDGQKFEAVIPHGFIPNGIAFSANNLFKFWVGCQEFVQPALFTPLTGLTFSPGVFANPSAGWVRDIDANDQGDLYVLYDNKVDLYTSVSTTGQTVVTMNDEQWRFFLEVVPALAASADGITSRMRSRWNGLLEAAVDRRYRLPWMLRADWTECPKCEVEDRKRERTEALAYLAEGKRDYFVDVSEITTFLAGARGSDAAAASLFLDELLIAPKDNK